ncbi:MAG: iron-containing alcohol dehydrogenase [Spirochaetaceae bacterium]|nr:iron-containing alcohol dehydrogenase [Spirochaetaceae bacterium]
MADLQFKISPNIVLATYISSRLGLYAKEWGDRYMVIVDPVLKEVRNMNTLYESLATRNIDYFIFDEIDFSADSETVKRALSLARNAYVQGIIAIGGSSVFGIARSVCALFNETHDIYDVLDGASIKADPLPLIAVPSTIRSPFLFTEFVPLIDARSRQIRILKVHPSLCKLALFDPTLHVSLSQSQMKAIALETLGIAVEAYLSQKANFFSDMFAEKAIELLGSYLNASEGDVSAISPEVMLSQGGCMASLAITTSSVGPATLTALAVGARYKITHSLTGSILFPYMLEDVALFKRDRIVRVAQLLGIEEDLVGDKDRIVALLAERIRHWIALANLPARLKDLSLTMEQFIIAAEDVSQLELVNSMPRSMGADDLFELMKRAF